MPCTETLLRHATKPDAEYLKHVTEHHLSDWYRDVRTGTWPKAIEPCRVMDLVVGGIADDYTGRLTAVRADITRCPAATERYGITGAPSYVLLKKGEAVAHGTRPMTVAEAREVQDGHL